VFKAILSSVEEVALPGNVTDTKPLYFDGLLGKLRKSNFWRYVRAENDARNKPVLFFSFSFSFFFFSVFIL